MSELRIIAEELIQIFGKRENFCVVGYCGTRLRIIVNNDKLVDTDSIASLDYIKGYLYQNEHQLIFKKDIVENVYNELIKLNILPTSIKTESLVTAFKKVFKHDNNVSVVFAPGRVNLIGEHTDYNGGHVFPAALDIGTYIAISPRTDNTLRLYSLGFDHLGVIEYNLKKIETKDPNLDWANYPIGVIVCLKQQGFILPSGFDVFVQGTIPHGAGLSSSASLGVAFVKALSHLFKFDIDGIQTAIIAQKAEHYAGTMCGIMDQFASSMGKENHGILLDCNTLKYKYAPIDLGEYTLMIMNSNKQRALNESKYNERRAECEKGLAILQKTLAIKSLGELTEDQYFLQAEKLMEDPIIKKRVKHAILENARTLKAFKALENKDMVLFGKLLNESHFSLRDDYEVSGKELDVLTDAARNVPGVLGSRMTGAGFGGCAIALVPTKILHKFQHTVSEIYKEKTGLTVQFISTKIKDGVKVLRG